MLINKVDLTMRSYLPLLRKRRFCTLSVAYLGGKREVLVTKKGKNAAETLNIYLVLTFIYRADKINLQKNLSGKLCIRFANASFADVQICGEAIQPNNTFAKLQSKRKFTTKA